MILDFTSVDPILRIDLMILFQLFDLMFLLHYQPYDSKHQNMLEIAHQIFFTIILVFYQVLNDRSLSENAF